MVTDQYRPRRNDPRLETFKAEIAGRLATLIDERDHQDGARALAALAETTAEFGCTFFGKQVTLALFAELSRMVSAQRD